MGTEKPNLDELLTKLQTEEGKIKAILQAIEKKLTNNPKYLEKALQFYENNVDYAYAFAIAADKKDIKKADELYKKGIEFYEKYGLFLQAAKLAYIKGDIDTEIKEWEKEGRFDIVARLCRKKGDEDKARVYQTLADMLL